MPDEGTPHRIGYVLKMYPRFSETFVVTEILALQDQGADLDIFSLRQPVDGRFHESLSRVRAPVTYVPTPGKPPEIWGALAGARELHGERFDACIGEILAGSPTDSCQALLLAGLIRERGITHLHAHFGTIAAGVARLAARIAGVTYSVTLHAKDIFHEDVVDEELAARISDAAAVVTVSDFNERYLRERYGDATGNLVRIYNGIDLDAFTASRPDDRPPLVVGVGRLVEKKGFHHLVDALALLRDRGRPIRLELVGGGPEEQALRTRVAALDLDDQVTFHGPLTQAETRDRVRAAAVLAAPCVVGLDGNRDGLPTVILESLALGTPVVATPVTGIPEAVLHGQTGLLVPEGDVVALADALDRLVEDAGLRCRLAEQGRRHVEDQFDTRKNTGLLHAVIGARVAVPQGVGG
jgi:glycosyltransferase involved in cell wall biosynthesis